MGPEIGIWEFNAVLILFPLYHFDVILVYIPRYANFLNIRS